MGISIMKNLICTAGLLLATTSCLAAVGGEKVHANYNVIQVAAYYSQATAEKQLAKAPAAQHLRILAIKHDDHTIYKLVSGHFKSNASAASALKSGGFAKDAYINKITPAQHAVDVDANHSTASKAVSKDSVAKKAVAKKAVAKKAVAKKVASKDAVSKKADPKKLTAKKLVVAPVATKTASTQKANDVANKTVVKKVSESFTMHQGSLKANLVRFAHDFNYHLLWKVVDNMSNLPADYSWLGTATFQDAPLNMLQQIITPYNVKTSVWKANRVICITNNNTCTQ